MRTTASVREKKQRRRPRAPPRAALSGFRAFKVSTGAPQGRRLLWRPTLRGPRRLRQTDERESSGYVKPLIATVKWLVFPQPVEKNDPNRLRSSPTSALR